MMEQGETRYPHTKGKVLIGNWVAEKSVGYIDNVDPHWMKLGHKCLFSSNPVDEKQYISTSHRTYIPHIQPEFDKIPKRRDLLERFVYEQYITNEIRNMTENPKQPIDYTTEMQERYKSPVDMKPAIRKEKVCNVSTEEAVTFYTEHLSKIPGLTKGKINKPFRKSTNITRPLSECFHGKFVDDSYT